MSRTNMQYGIIRKEVFITYDGNEFESFNDAEEHQQEIFRKGIDLKLKTSKTTFGESIHMPNEFKYILVFGGTSPLYLLSHQLYMEKVYELLKSNDDVKVMGLDAKGNPIRLITVATKETAEHKSE